LRCLDFRQLPWNSLNEALILAASHQPVAGAKNLFAAGMKTPHPCVTASPLSLEERPLGRVSKDAE
jgi:hypothetical protein